MFVQDVMNGLYEVYPYTGSPERLVKDIAVIAIQHGLNTVDTFRLKMRTQSTTVTLNAEHFSK